MKSLSEWRILRGNILLRAGFNKLADRDYLSGVNEGRGKRSSLELVRRALHDGDWAQAIKRVSQ